MEEIINKLKKYGQQHLLVFFNSLNPMEKQELIEDISQIDFDYINSFKQIKDKVECVEKIEPVTAHKSENLTDVQINALKAKGKDIILQGKYAIVTMAGGQGTRLGHDGPKGTFALNLGDKQKYIFEIFIDNLQKIYDTYGVHINWYIMTSKANNSETIDFFEEHNYFGYPKEMVKFFMQGELPITDMDGNLLLENTHKVLKAADGNGGVFNAIAQVLPDMKNKGIQWLLVTGVDNILVNMADELYIGLVASEGYLNGVKSIVKTSPEEKVGVFCKRNGKPSVIEYSEMNDEMRYAKGSNGDILYSEANIVNHLINIKIIEKIQHDKLPIHKAIKQMGYIDTKGNVQKPTEPCLVKYEAFIFDYFNKVDEVTILRVAREKEFAPVKNKSGVDSPETAIELYNKLNAKEV